MKKKILFITGSRSDFYIQKPIIDAVKSAPFLKALLVITGSHLSKRFGYTKSEFLNQKYNVVAKIKNLVISDNYSARLKSASNQLQKLSDEDDVRSIAEKIKEVAKKGMLSTKDLIATKGRASFLGERARGHIDPGARSSQLAIEAICNTIINK